MTETRASFLSPDKASNCPSFARCSARKLEGLRNGTHVQDGIDSPEAMEAALNFILKWGSALALILIPIWPLLTLPAGVFSEGYFTFWVIVSMTWYAAKPSRITLSRILMLSSVKDNFPLDAYYGTTLF